MVTLAILSLSLGLLLMPIIWYLTLKYYRNWNHNLQIAAKILGIQRKKLFSYEVVEGDYKGRKIIFIKDYVGPILGIILKIFPHTLPRGDKKGFVLFYPRPTKNTSFHHGAILYQPPVRDSAVVVNLDRACSEQEIIKVFDELTKAAEIVESGASYYKE